MSKLGIALPGALSMVAGVAAYVPRPAYPRKDTTYVRADDITAALGSKLSPGETPRQPLDRITNLAQLFNFPQPPPPSAAGCVGVSQTFTSTGTFTANCTGTLTMEVWGPGASPTDIGHYSGSGGGAFASSSISVTNGQTWLAIVPGAGHFTSDSAPAAICPTGVTDCTVGIASCSGTGLSISNLVCAINGRQAAAGSPTGGLGGSTASSVGVTLFKGGNGGSGSSSASAGGGGSGGPDGAGNNGTPAVGGSGDAGSGGVGGTYGVGHNGGDGGSNIDGGGGGGGTGFGYVGGLGGNPGGGNGGSNNAITQGRAQVIVHSDASDVLTPVLTGSSTYGGGTVSMA